MNLPLIMLHLMSKFFIFFSAVIFSGMVLSCGSAQVQPETVQIGKESYRVKWLYSEPFGENWQEQWTVEGDSLTVTSDDGMLLVDDYKGATIWHAGEYPKNLFVRFNVRGVERVGNKTNFNLITHATETDGSPLVIGGKSGRDGQYKQYHVFPNYIATFVYKWTRLRKDPGFNLLSERETGSVAGTEYEIVFTANNGILRYYINGEKQHEMTDDAPLSGGKVGLRTWDTKAYWYDVKIGEIIN
jgi:hypothetical protein